MSIRLDLHSPLPPDAAARALAGMHGRWRVVAAGSGSHVTGRLATPRAYGFAAAWSIALAALTAGAMPLLAAPGMPPALRDGALAALLALVGIGFLATRRLARRPRRIAQERLAPLARRSASD